jgi:hypothetical protein
MDSTHFDGLARSVSILLSRRALVSALGVAAIARPGVAGAKRHQHEHKKARFNAFGCVNVGHFCKNNGQCCSGICQGKKGKKKCQAHDQSTCQAGAQEGFCNANSVNVPCVSSTGETGTCDTTTGEAAYCTVGGNCFACAKDVDCVPFCGPQAACIVCGNNCDFLNLSTACVGPLAGGCKFPAL